jgi:peptidoglycan/xylan/chitin deacetylase (PgdA/CDA1 family)
MKTKSIIIVCLLGITVLTGCQAADASQPQPTVCLFFDDAWLNQYEEALPVLLEHGFTATFGVITGYIGTGEGIWQYMSEEELHDLADRGMEIASHTRTHPSLTDNLTDLQLIDEIINSRSDLEEIGFEVKGIIYPYYDWDERVIEYVKAAGYSYARNGWGPEIPFPLPLPADDSVYHLPSVSIYKEDMETFKSIVGAVSPGSAICLVYHFISDTGPEETSTPVANFHAQMDYLEEAGFRVIAISELLD